MVILVHLGFVPGSRISWKANNSIESSRKSRGHPGILLGHPEFIPRGGFFKLKASFIQAFLKQRELDFF